MRRDHDLIRAIILHVEDHPHGHAPPDLTIDGYSKEHVLYHSWLIVHQELANGFDVTRLDSQSPAAIITSLTPAGHTFAEAARNDAVWRRTSDWAKRAGGVAFNVLVDKLMGIAADHAAKFIG